MIKTKTITQELIKTFRYCDICEHPAHTQCCKCGKDLCNKCVEHEKDDYDYRGDCYCKSCWDAGKEIREEIAELEAQIDKLNDMWDEKCKNNES